MTLKSILDYLKKTYPCRDHQIEMLYNLLGHQEEPLVDAIYIYGCSSTGKSSTVSALLENTHSTHAIVSLVECHSTKLLLETILNKLAGHKVDSFRGQPFARCDNMMDFIDNLKRIEFERAVIVLDKAERLRNMDFNLLPAFLKLRELTGLHIAVVLISEIVFEKLYARAPVVDPIKIQFPQYSKEELTEILQLNIPEIPNFEVTLEFYTSYLNMFLQVFYRVCRDVSELRHTSRINFVKYCDPIIKGDIAMENSVGLWRNISPVLRAALEVLYLRISLDEDRASFVFSKECIAHSLELPFYSKYLLIAAYLASYNPSKEDKRLFVKAHGKKTKTMKDVKAKNKVSEKFNTQLGPKTFGLDRLVAIFYAIMDENVDFNSGLLVQISSLVELQLITAVADNCDFDERKYKCAVGLEFVQIIANSVGLNVSKYLVDFN